jgi:hypothetical protein
MRKNRIESARIERVADYDADTSTIGEYTDKRTDWAICRHCGEYVAIAEKDNERADEIETEIIDLENEENYEAADNSEAIRELKRELDSLDLHTCQKSSREYNYFTPYAGGETPGTEDYQKYGKQDFKRMEGLNNGDWNFIGIIAKAEIITESGTIQTIRSGGLWGIESDAGTYLDEVAQEELENLRAELTALGFGKRSINYAFKNVETVDR